jgi:hypothetical protein
VEQGWGKQDSGGKTSWKYKTKDMGGSSLSLSLSVSSYSSVRRIELGYPILKTSILSSVIFILLIHQSDLSYIKGYRIQYT